jgi:nucleoside-diphosphate-sugar epimerase
MRIFIAGASGTLGRPVAAQLLSRGHDVVGLSRSERGRAAVERAGAKGIIGDAMHRAGLMQIVADAHPDVVVHLLTALPADGAFRAADLVATNRLRTEGTANLIDAAVAAGARRIVAESFVGVYGEAAFTTPSAEDIVLPPVSRGPARDATLAMRASEDRLLAAKRSGSIEAVALRIGLLYGPGVPTTALHLSQARRGWLFAPKHAPGIGSFVHISDAASAIVAAIEARSPSFLYNVVDDAPIPLTDYMALTSQAAGARAPREIPLWLIRLAAPLIAEFASVRLSLSNGKIKRELGWKPVYPTVASGMKQLVLAEAA